MPDFEQRLSQRNKQLFDIYTKFLYDKFMMTTLENQQGHTCYLTVSWTGIANWVHMIILSPDIQRLGNNKDLYAGYGEDSVVRPTFYIDKDSGDLIVQVGNTICYDTETLYNAVVEAINTTISARGHDYVYVGTDLKVKYSKLNKRTRTLLYPYSMGSSEDFITAVINRESEASNS